MIIKKEFEKIMDKIWIEMPLYYFNNGNSIRFELVDKCQDDEKIYEFIERLFNFLFEKSNLVYVIQITDANLRCRQNLHKILSLKNKPVYFHFKTRHEQEDLEKNQVARLYVIAPSEINKRKLFSLAYYEKLDSQLFILDPINLRCFNIYDQRGLDITCVDKKFLRQVYMNFSEWVFDYNRKEIECALLEVDGISNNHGISVNEQEDVVSIFPKIVSFAGKNLKNYIVDENELLLKLSLYGSCEKLDYIKMSKFKKLQELEIDFIKSFDFEKISEFKELRIIVLTYGKIINFESIVKLEKLDSISILYNKTLTSIEGISQNKTIKKIILKGCSKLIDLSEIGEIEQLESLMLESMKNRDFSFIKKLKNLKKLSLCNCGEIDSVKFVEEMPNLKSVIILETNIKDGDLTPLKNLKYANIDDKRHYNTKSSELPTDEAVIYGYDADSDKM